MSQQSTGPAISTLQMDGSSIGDIGKSVNLFRGDVTFPLTFMQLPGPNGLDVKVSATYSGNVASEVTTWNLDAPTGLLGLGWDLPIDHIAFGAPGSASPKGAVYFLFSQGVASPLVPIKTGYREGVAYCEFALAQYRPWRILYFPEAELWEVTQENGITFTYGDSRSGRSTLQWAVRRDNWVGHSSLDAGERYPVAWNLSTVKHYWGDTIRFTYENDEVPIGSGGLSYTRASRVASIVDAYGRVVSYRYLPKEPSEYQPPHGRRRPDDPPNGYQDRYEPHYLASVSVNTPAGNELLELTFGYELASVVDCPTGSFTKRYLTSVAQSAEGAPAAPSTTFSYVNAPLEPDGAPPNGLGSLSSIQYPSGATARYRYGLNELTDRGLAVTAPPIGGVPRVWFGPDYIVVTWCSASELVVTAYSWSGCWVPWTTAGSISVAIPDGGESLSVIPSRDFFALTYLDSGSVPALRLYRKNPERFGSWTIFAPTGFTATAPDASPSQLAVGDRFVVFNPAGTRQLCRYSWNPMSAVWEEQSQTVSAARLAISARANYFVVMAFESGIGTMTLHHHDLVGRWSSTEFPETVSVAAPGAPRFSWSLGASFAIATFVEPDGIGESEIRYDVRAYHWDRELSRVTCKYRGSFQSSTTLGLPPIATRVAGSLVGNLNNVLRYDGSEWQSQTLPCNASQEYGSLFAYGEDLALATDTGGAATGYVFDADQCALISIPLEDATPNGSLPPRPTVAGDYLTVGAQVYFRDPTQGWTLMPSSLPSGVHQNSIANRAPAYIAYEVGTGSSAVAGLLLIRNGELHAEQAELLAGQRIFADKQHAPGTILCGDNAFVTWSGADFDAATTLHLYHVANGAIGVQRHCPVIGIDVDDGYGTTSTSYWYDRAVATFDASGTVAQYARVRTFPGVASAPRDGGDTGGHPCPNGFTETLFYNGMDPDVPGLFYPGDTANYSSLLNANLLGQKSFDSRGRLVAYQLNRYRRFVPSDVPPARALKISCNLESSSITEVFRLDSEGLLGYLNAGGTGTMPAALSQAFAANGYVLSGEVTVEVERLYRAWILIDEKYLNFYLAVSDGSEIAILAGFTRGQRVEYEPRRGFLESASTVNRNAAFEIEHHTQTVTYACDQHDTQGRPVYPVMRDLHILTPIVQATQRVNGIVTGRTLTLYDNQWGYGESCWSARAEYQALEASASFGFDEGSTPDAASWRRTSQVISRNRRGSETESVDVEGVHTSTVYDVNDAIAVVQVKNASARGGECAYFGAEPYERNPGWSIEPGGAAPAVSEGQAHTGTRSILLAPDPTAVLTFRRQNVQPTGGNHRYLFSFRYCTDAGFEDESGDAGFQVTVGCGTSSRALPVVPLRGTEGDWQLALATIDPVEALGLDVPPDGFSLELQVYNHKSTGSLRLDELRLIPLVSEFSASVVDLEREVEVASLSQTGQALRTVYDAANAPFATTALDGSPVSISATYQSRAGNDNELSALDPSFQLSIAPAGPGVFQDYRRIRDWSRFWNGTAGSWEVTGGALAHTASTLDTLTLRASPARGDFGVRLRVRPRAEVTSPLTLAYGDLSISWIPGAGATVAGAWRFGEDASTDVGPSILCFLPARFSGSLDQGKMIPPLQTQLASLGVRVSARSIVTVVSEASRWTLTDPDAGQRYLVEKAARGLAVTCLTLPDVELTFVVGEAAVLFYAGGRPVFQRALASGASGELRLSTSALVSFQDVLVFTRPRVSVEYVDGCGRTTQAQALEVTPAETGASPAPSCLVTCARYDELGRLVLQTKPIRYPRTLFGYHPSAITAIDPETWAMQGDCNDYYSPGGDGFSDDGGYPYSRSRYGDWPGADVIEQGQPGAALAITRDDPADHHTLRTSIAASSAADVFHHLGFVSGDYLVTTSLDADGNANHELTDKMGRVLARSSDTGGKQLQTTYVYDAAGRMVAISPPKAQAGSDTDPPQASTTVSYDFNGNRLHVSQPDADAPTRFAYDRAGRLRFLQDAPGARAPTPYIQYWKYDRLGRLVQAGTVDFDWSQLTDQADDPTWPPPQPAQIAAGELPEGTTVPVTTWRNCLTYDGDGETAFALGRLTTMYTNNGDQGQADVIESFAYDVRGNVAANSVIVTGWGSEVFTTRYTYDNQDAVTNIVYPDGTTQICYGHDSVGRLAGIGCAPGDTSIARYTYHAAGFAANEHLGAAGSSALTRSYAYNSPGWVTGIDDPYFQQTVRYGVAGGKTYYSGRIAELDASYAWPGAPAPASSRFEFDAIGQLVTAQNSALPRGSLGTERPQTYDDNGNITLMSRSGAPAPYRYDGSTNRVVDDGRGGTFGYDAGGAVTAATRAGLGGRNLAQIAYDRCTRLPRTIEVAGATAASVTFSYDGEGRRVLKQVNDGTNTTTTLYLHGLGSGSLVEQCRTGDAGATNTWAYVYGPRGVTRVSSDGAPYVVLADYQGSTRALVDPAGAIAAQFDYSPFGDVIRSSGDDSLMRYLYTGQEYDSETGLYNYSARLYDSQLGRFYSLDPLSQLASPYCYVANDPVNLVDPSGMWSLGIVTPRTVPQRAGYIATFVEVIISGVELVAGVILSFRPGLFGHMLGGALIGAGVRGLVYGLGHFGDTNLSGGFLRGQVVGAVLGGIGSFFTRPTRKMSRPERVVHQASTDVLEDAGSAAVTLIGGVTGRTADLRRLLPPGSTRRRAAGATAIAGAYYVAPQYTTYVVGGYWGYKLMRSAYYEYRPEIRSATRAAIGYATKPVTAAKGWFSWGVDVVDGAMKSLLRPFAYQFT